MLNPVFSIAHMRGMVPIFNEVGHKVGSTHPSATTCHRARR